MHQCTVSSLFKASAGFASLLAGQLQIVQTVLLCKILQANDPMADCTSQALLDAGKCYACLGPGQLQIIQTQLLCEILQAGGGGGSSCLLCSPTADPVDPPECPCALYYRKDNGRFWYWEADPPNGPNWILFL